jgi:hypothetical protein
MASLPPPRMLRRWGIIRDLVTRVVRAGTRWGADDTAAGVDTGQLAGLRSANGVARIAARELTSLLKAPPVSTVLRYLRATREGVEQR